MTCINYRETIRGEPAPCIFCDGNDKKCDWFKEV